LFQPCDSGQADRHDDSTRLQSTDLDTLSEVWKNLPQVVTPLLGSLILMHIFWQSGVMVSALDFQHCLDEQEPLR
jgi:hypothetical protein